ncbi:MAG: hypothetical protein ACRDHG_13740 [Anaerolineales bacterium]
MARTATILLTGATPSTKEGDLRLFCQAAFARGSEVLKQSDAAALSLEFEVVVPLSDLAAWQTYALTALKAELAALGSGNETVDLGEVLFL